MRAINLLYSKLRSSSFQHWRQAMSDEGGGAIGWLVMIGILLLINGLSYLFNWGFWLY